MGFNANQYAGGSGHYLGWHSARLKRGMYEYVKLRNLTPSSEREKNFLGRPLFYADVLSLFADPTVFLKVSHNSASR